MSDKVMLVIAGAVLSIVVALSGTLANFVYENMLKGQDRNYEAIKENGKFIGKLSGRISKLEP